MTETDAAVMYLVLGYLVGHFVARLLKNRTRMRRVFPRKPMATPWDDPRDVTGKFKRIRWIPNSRN